MILQYSLNGNKWFQLISTKKVEKSILSNVRNVEEILSAVTNLDNTIKVVNDIIRQFKLESKASSLSETLPVSQQTIKI